MRWQPKPTAGRGTDSRQGERCRAVFVWRLDGSGLLAHEGLRCSAVGNVVLATACVAFVPLSPGIGQSVTDRQDAPPNGLHRYLADAADGRSKPFIGSINEAGRTVAFTGDTGGPSSASSAAGVREGSGSSQAASARTSSLQPLPVARAAVRSVARRVVE
jgi:hypothetical protein